MDLNSATEVLLSESDPKISIEHLVTTSSLSSAGIKMSHDCFLCIKCMTPCCIEDVLQSVVYPVQKFFSFCVGQHISIDELKFLYAGSNKYIKYYTPFTSNKKDISDSDNMPLSYIRIKDTLVKMFNSWMSFEGDLERGVSLLVSLLTFDWKMPLDLEFLAAAQMLETIARHDQVVTELSSSRFDEYLKIIEESIAIESIRKWALLKIKYSNYKSQRKLISSLLNRLGAFTQYIIPDKNRFLNNHILLRNAYTHRSDECESSKILNGADLFWHTQAVLYLSYGAVLFYLGYTQDDIIEVFTNSNYQWYKVTEVKKFYAKGSRSMN